ADLPFEF
nr:Chain P, C-terminus heptapeptide from PapR protein [Bacillus cereus]3U3W_Q Chain Q, C-terminus heptapeptide from PapR protein [Bacillus cereus]